MNRDDRRQLKVMLGEVEDFIRRVEVLSSDLQDRLDNVMEHFPDSERVGTMEEEIEQLDVSVWTALDEAKDALETALDMG